MTQSECTIKTNLNVNKYNQTTSIMSNSTPLINKCLNIDNLLINYNNKNINETNFDININSNAINKSHKLFLNDSGYSDSSSFRSFNALSLSETETNNIKKPNLLLYGTGWMVAENLSDSDDDELIIEKTEKNVKDIASTFVIDVFENLKNVIYNKNVEPKPKHSNLVNNYYG